MARLLVKRGVRLLQLFFSGTSWDHHPGLRAGLTATCAASELPVAELLRDLKARGLHEDTVVIWSGEFGRTSTAEGDNDGRKHHSYGFTVWLAGGGVRDCVGENLMRRIASTFENVLEGVYRSLRLNSPLSRGGNATEERNTTRTRPRSGCQIRRRRPTAPNSRSEGRTV
jgi:hypothetical protein